MLLLRGTENLPLFPTLNTDTEPRASPKPRAEPHSLPSLL